MSFKWFRMLFPPLGGDLRQFCLRRTAPQSKIISKNFRQTRLASHHAQQQSKVDLIKRNVELLDQISKKTTKLSSCTRLHLDQSEPNLRKKLSPFMMNRPSSRCYLRNGTARKHCKTYLGRSKTSLSKKMSTIERFHLSNQESLERNRSSCPNMPKTEEQAGFLHRPTTRRIQVSGFSNWQQPVYPMPSLIKKDAPIPIGNVSMPPTSNMQLVRSTIQQNKAEFCSKAKEIEKFHVRKTPGASAMPLEQTNDQAIKLRKSTKTVDLHSENSAKLKLPKNEELPSFKPHLTAYMEKLSDLKKCVFEPPKIKLRIEKPFEHELKKKPKTTMIPKPLFASDPHKPTFHLVRNPFNGKLEVKEVKPKQTLTKVESSPKIVPPELSEKSFKDTFLSKFTPAQCFFDYKSKMEKPKVVVTQEAVSKQVQSKTKKVKIPLRIKKTVITKSKLDHHMLDDEEPKLVWQKQIREQHSLECIRKAKEFASLANDFAFDNNRLKANLTPETKRSQTRTNASNNLQYGHLPEPVYRSFCDIAKRKNLFAYVPRTKPKIKITFPMYGVNHNFWDGRPSSWRRVLKSLQTNAALTTSAPVTHLQRASSKKISEKFVPLEESKSSSTSVGAKGILGKSPKLPSGLLAMCRHTAEEISAMQGQCRGAHALFALHKPKTKVSVTHNIKKPSTASLESVHHKNKLKQRGLKSYRISSKDFGNDTKAEDLDSFVDPSVEDATYQSSKKDLQTPVNTQTISNLSVPRFLPKPSSDKTDYCKLRQSPPLKACQLCGLYHSLSAHGKCPLAAMMKVTESFPLNPMLSSLFKRTYSTSSSKKGILPTTTDELLHVCRYCGLIHTELGKSCPMSEAIKLFVSQDQKKAGFKLVQPSIVNNIPKKEVMLKRIQNIHDKLHLFKCVKTACEKNRNKALTIAPSAKITFKKPIPSVGKSPTGLKSIIKSYQKKRKNLPHLKQFRDGDRSKFSKSFGDLLTKMMQECHTGLKLNSDAKIVQGRMDFIVEEAQIPKHDRREIHDDPTLHPARCNTPQKDEARKTLAKPEVNVSYDAKNVSYDAKKTKYNFEITCRRIISTRNSSTSGSRNFNTSCVQYIAQKKAEEPKTPPRTPKSPQGQSAQIHKHMCVGNLRSEIIDKHRHSNESSRVVNITAIPKYDEPPKICDKSPDKNDTKNKPDNVKNMILCDIQPKPKSPVKRLSVKKNTEADYKDKRMRDCIEQLKGHVDLVETQLRASHSEPIIGSPRKTFRVAMGMSPTSPSKVTRASSEVKLNRPKSTQERRTDSQISLRNTTVVEMQSSKAPLHDRIETKNRTVKVAVDEPTELSKITASQKIPVQTVDKQSRPFSTNDSIDWYRGQTPSSRQKSKMTPRSSSVKEFLKKGKSGTPIGTPRANASSGQKSSRNLENCPPPSSCPICPGSGNEDYCAQRKLCNKKASIKDTIMELMKIKDFCEMDLLQARIRKQQAKLAAQKKEDEFYKFYRCNEHKTPVREACIVQTPKTCEDKFVKPCKPRVKLNNSCGISNADLISPMECNCCEPMQSKIDKVKKVCEERMSYGRKSQETKCKPHSPRRYEDVCDQRDVRKDSRRIKLKECEKKENIPRLCLEDEANVEKNKDLMQMVTSPRFRLDCDPDIDNCEPKLKKCSLRTFETNKELKNGDKREYKTDNCKQKYDKDIEENDKCEEKEDEMPRFGVSTHQYQPPKKAERYQFSKPSTETVIEFVTEDCRTGEHKDAEARLRKTAVKLQQSQNITEKVPPSPIIQTPRKDNANHQFQEVCDQEKEEECAPSTKQSKYQLDESPKVCKPEKHIEKQELQKVSKHHHDELEEEIHHHEKPLPSKQRSKYTFEEALCDKYEKRMEKHEKPKKHDDFEPEEKAPVQASEKCQYKEKPKSTPRKIPEENQCKEQDKEKTKEIKLESTTTCNAPPKKMLDPEEKPLTPEKPQHRCMNLISDGAKHEWEWEATLCKTLLREGSDSCFQKALKFPPPKLFPPNVKSDLHRDKKKEERESDRNMEQDKTSYSNVDVMKDVLKRTKSDHSHKSTEKYAKEHEEAAKPKPKSPVQPVPPLVSPKQPAYSSKDDFIDKISIKSVEKKATETNLERQKTEMKLKTDAKSEYDAKSLNKQKGNEDNLEVTFKDSLDTAKQSKDLPKSKHLCYSKDVLNSAKQEYFKCNTPRPNPIKEECIKTEEVDAEEKLDEFTSARDNHKKHYPRIPMETTKTPVKDKYRLEPIRFERYQSFEQELKKLESLQKEIKVDDSKRLFCVDEIKDVQNKIAELKDISENIKPGLSTKEINDRIETIQDYKKLLDLRNSPEITNMNLHMSSDKIADLVYEKLVKASREKMAKAKLEEKVFKTGIHVCKPDGSVTEISPPSTVSGGSANSRKPQKKWTKKITAAMHSTKPQKQKTPEVQFANLTKDQMEVICHKVLQEIDILRAQHKKQESKELMVKHNDKVVAPKKLPPLDCSKSLKKFDPGALIKSDQHKTPQQIADVSPKSPKTPPKWKYLDNPNTYAYNQLKKYDKTGLQLHKCMEEVKRCLDDYKKCLLDMKLMPQMDKHFEYDLSEVRTSTPNLPIGKHEKFDDILEDDANSTPRSVGKCRSFPQLSPPSPRVERKCSSKLTPVPMLMPGHHPISVKNQRSTTSDFNQKARHQSADFSTRSNVGVPMVMPPTSMNYLGFPDVDGEVAPINAKPNKSGSNVMQRTPVNPPGKQRGYHNCTSISDVIELENELQDDEDTKKGRTVFDEVVLYFPRDEECVDLELLFHPNVGKATHVMAPPAGVPAIPVDFVKIEGKKECMKPVVEVTAMVEEPEVVRASIKLDELINVDMPTAVIWDSAENKTVPLPNFPAEAETQSAIVPIPETVCCPKMQKYSYTKLIKPDFEEEDTPLDTSNYGKPMQLFQQIYEVTTSKLKSITKKPDWKFLSSKDNFWPKEHYPKAYKAQENRHVVLESKNCSTNIISRPSTREKIQKVETFIDKDIGLLTARVVSKPRSRSPQKPKLQPILTQGHGGKSLERQESLTNIFRNATQALKEASDRCCVDLKKSLERKK